nr:MAG TPA: hypothetical protein [Caudoviricetes sp.]
MLVILYYYLLYSYIYHHLVIHQLNHNVYCLKLLF